MHCVNSVFSFLTGHQGKQHYHVGGLGESMREECVATDLEKNDPHLFSLLSLLALFV